MFPSSFYLAKLRRRTRAGLGAVVISILSMNQVFATLGLDTTFGTAGKVTIGFPDSTSTNYTAFGQRIFVQPEGRIVAGGSFTNRGPDGQATGVAFAGLLTSGGIDTTYANNGRITDWDPIAVTSFSDAYMYPDGRVIRVSQHLSLSLPNSGPKVVRLKADGTPDTFAADVAVPGTFNTIPLEVAVRPDGKIYVLVFAQTSPDTNYLFRLNPDGSRDSTFGVNGALLMNFKRIGGPNLTFHMELLPDGRILLAGTIGSSTSSGYPEFFLLRLDSNGHPDKSFGRHGVLRMPFGTGQSGFVNNLYIQPDGKILLVGAISTPDLDVWMRRFTANGKADGSFGSAGVAVIDFASGLTDRASAAVLSSDNKIRIAGEVGTPGVFLIARLSSAGAVEDQITTAFTEGHPSGANDLTLQPDGKILAIGYTRNPDTAITGNVWAIARYTE